MSIVEYDCYTPDGPGEPRMHVHAGSLNYFTTVFAVSVPIDCIIFLYTPDNTTLLGYNIWSILVEDNSFISPLDHSSVVNKVTICYYWRQQLHLPMYAVEMWNL